MIAIIDYDAGNLKSVEKACVSLGLPCVVTRERREILGADRVILPGVGSFGMAMEQLKRYELDKVICEVTGQGKPLMGICLGLQLLFSGSEESSGVEGLGLLEGRIVRIPACAGRKIPHIGWNSLALQNDGRLFCELPIQEGAQPYVYFVHSYYLMADDPSIVTAVAEYGVSMHVSVEHENIFACQFHPEKSSAVGLQILKNFGNVM